jgi:hypothetical protein
MLPAGQMSDHKEAWLLLGAAQGLAPCRHPLHRCAHTFMSAISTVAYWL